MFGGHGVFKDDVMFALIADEVVYFKVDATSKADFAAAGGAPFVYVKNGQPMTMSYWRVSEPCPIDDADLLRWAHVAHQAAERQKRKRKT
jgi:DNA transformation protein